MPGLLLLLGAVVLAGVMLTRKDLLSREKNLYGFSLVCIFFAAIALLLCTTLVPWDYLRTLPFIGSIANSIQFPWRFLSMATLLLAFCAAIVVPLFSKGWTATQKAMLFLAITLFASIAPLYSMDTSTNKDTFYTKNQAADTYADSMYLPEGYPDNFALTELGNEIVSDSSSFEATGYSREGTQLDFEYSGNNVSWIELPFTCYDGYTITDETGGSLRINRVALARFALSMCPMRGRYMLGAPGCGSSVWGMRSARFLSCGLLCSWLCVIEGQDCRQTARNVLSRHNRRVLIGLHVPQQA